MKKAVKLIIFLLTITMTFSACGPKSVINQEGKYQVTTSDSYPLQTDVTISWWLPMNTSVASHAKDYNGTELAKAIQKQTGIGVEFISPPINQHSEHFNLMLASGELPDIIQQNWVTVYPGGPERAIEENIILNLNEVMDLYSPNLKKVLDSSEEFNKNAKTDQGNYFCYPFIREDEILRTFNGFMIREDLLEKNNLSVPETLEEWERVLTAFKNDGVEIPLSVRLTSAYLSKYSPFIGAFGISGGFFHREGKVHYGPYTDEYKEFISLMSKWYNEGLLDKDYVNTDATRLASVVANGQVGAVLGSAGGEFGKWLPALAQNHPEAKYIPAPFPAEKKGETPQFGHKELTMRGDGCSISAQCKNVEYAARLLDFGYSEAGKMLYNFGIEGESYTMQKNIPTYTETITNPDKNGGLSMSQALSNYVFAYNNGPFVQSKDYITQYYTLPEQRDALEVWSKNDDDKNQMPLLYFTQEESSELARVMADVGTYYQEATTKMITGKESVEDFDSYLKNMKDMGIEKIIDLYQVAYERYLSK